MKLTSWWMHAVIVVLAVLLAVPLPALAQSDGSKPPPQSVSKEELAQLVAPIALYPDELVTQVLMASTYPLEIVQADRWVKKNKDLKGDALAKALEKEKWDPSVKSLVNFPSVLAALSEKLDQTTKLGDAFLAQQKDVMDTIQLLRKKAYDAGNLKTTKEQKIVVEQETIIIKPADPQVIYVPSYSTTVVYGAWPYPAYPPYYYYPPPPPAYPAYHFAAGVAVGVAWGYAWGNANWHGGDVNINHNQNINVNNNIDRSKYQNQAQQRQGGSNSWQHDSSHRQGVAYKDNKTAQKYGQSSARTADASRGSRGYGDGQKAGGGARPETGATGGKGSASDRSAGAGGGRDSAFSGGSGSGSRERAASDRGSASRQSASSASRGGGGGFSGGGGGGARGGGGGSRGGGGGGRR